VRRDDRLQKLDDLLEAKSLNYREVIPYDRVESTRMRRMRMIEHRIAEDSMSMAELHPLADEL
jgi:hypothetical protein